jgi:hypothetical protein
MKTKLYLLKGGIFILLMPIISGCYFVAKPEYKNEYSDSCILSTPSWRIDSKSLRSSPQCSGGGDNAVQCLALLGIVPAGSFVVAGSIYITGNTVQWLEYQGRCSDSEINAALKKMKQKLISLGRN